MTGNLENREATGGLRTNLYHFGLRCLVIEKKKVQNLVYVSFQYLAITDLSKEILDKNRVADHKNNGLKTYSRRSKNTIHLKHGPHSNYLVIQQVVIKIQFFFFLMAMPPWGFM